MQNLHRRCLPAVLALVIALATAASAPEDAAATSDYAATCTARLRAAPSTAALTLITMPAGTVVTSADTIQGGTWSAACGTEVSGSTWYAITAVDGTSVLSLYGVSVAYAAAGLFGPWTAPTPTPAVYLEGIDVSRYQMTIDWTQVAAAGKRFVIMKATEGQTLVDPMYAANHAAARTVGLPVTAYHFAFPLGSPGDAVIQADWFAQNAGLLPGDLVPALDLERSGGLSTPDLQAWVGAWLGEVYAKLGVRPMIYTSPAFWANSMGNTTMFAEQGFGVLWIAHWFTSSPSVAAGNWGGQGWTFWQYSNCGSVAGISGCVDLDRYNGADLGGLMFDYSPVPPVIPPVAPPEVPPNVPPFLAAIMPASAPAGAGDLVVSIQGADFAPGVSSAYWNGMPLATTYVSPTQLTATVPAALTAQPGAGFVTVLNQPPGGGSSAPAAFSVMMPLPPLSIDATSALGLRPPTGYTTRTPKVAKIGAYVTWKFVGGAAMAGQRVNILVAQKVGGTWTVPRYLKSAWADLNGVVTFWSRSKVPAAINVRVQWAGNAAYGVSTSAARGAYWK